VFARNRVAQLDEKEGSHHEGNTSMRGMEFTTEIFEATGAGKPIIWTPEASRQATRGEASKTSNGPVELQRRWPLEFRRGSQRLSKRQFSQGVVEMQGWGDRLLEKNKQNAKVADWDNDGKGNLKRRFLLRREKIERKAVRKRLLKLTVRLDCKRTKFYQGQEGKRVPGRVASG